MLKNNEKQKSVIKYTFVFEIIVMVIVALCISVLFSANGGVISVLQFIGSKIQTVYPFASFWLFMFNGVLSQSVALICLSVILFVCRVLNIFFLAKRKKFSCFVTGAIWFLDLACVLIAFFTSNRGPGTEYFEYELMSVAATVVTSSLMFILLRALYKTGDGSVSRSRKF